ncbi:class I SAM-dependent methyltransferase [Novosphingobium sp. MBES04]|uniref:class I SAM-dependent methyltransferase n=1 Tax=Novosphingobium sp. MBES04 TaxID=1206458 RepID=UPI00057C4715|nr:class I SAM-dependent methyltransferase [Novosphingobium sp. MBES04]
MEADVYIRMNELEGEHWWFAARRRIIAEVLERLIPPRPSGETRDILEAGCGTGGNLAMFARYGALDAFEYDEQARQQAIRKSGLDILPGALPGAIPFGDKCYDLICILDVLEHIEDDVASLLALRARLKRHGRILVTVPAFPKLWSHHDEAHHHFRRYTRNSLKEVVGKAGMKVEKSFYFNTLLLPLALATRLLKKASANESPDDSMPSAWLNTLLRYVFASERHVIGRVGTPFGLSLGAIIETGAD